MRATIRRGGERGSIAPMIPIMALVLLILGGLVIDASRQLNERGEAVAYAEEAARAGAQAVALGTGQLALDRAKVKNRVANYCAQIEHNDAVTSCRFEGISSTGGTDPRPLVVNVTVTMRINATLLGIVGVTHLTASGSGKAKPVEGLTSADQ